MPKREDWLKRTDRGMYARPEVLFEGPNARTVFDPEALETLRKQIQQEGVLEPLLVRRRENDEGGKLEVWDGGRRLRCVWALLDAGNPIEWVPVRISRGSNAELLLQAAATQVGKAPLDYLDEAGLIRMLRGYGLTEDEIAIRLGKSKTWVTQRVRLTELTPAAKAALRDGEITLGRALELVPEDDQEQERAVEATRERVAAGEKRAGGKQRKRPGKRAVRRLRDEVDGIGQTRSTWDLEAILTVLDWVAGDCDDTDDVREALGLPTKDPTRTLPDPRQTDLEDRTEDQHRRLCGVHDALGTGVVPEPPSKPTPAVG